MLGKRVKLAYVHDMSPMVVHEMVGEIGTVKERDKIVKEKDNITTIIYIWLVVFENGFRLWSREQYLEVMDG